MRRATKAIGLIGAAVCWTVSIGAWATAADWELEKSAQARTAKWLDDRGGKIVLELRATIKEPGFAGKAIVGSADTMHVLESKGWQVTLGFQGKLSREDSAATLDRRLKYVALDRIPTPGLEIKGWDVRPMTPQSSFREGVEIRELKDGLATIAIKTSCFALSGRVREELLGPQPADAGLPPGTFFQLRKNIPLEILIQAPIDYLP